MAPVQRQSLRILVLRHGARNRAPSSLRIRQRYPLLLGPRHPAAGRRRGGGRLHGPLLSSLARSGAQRSRCSPAADPARLHRGPCQRRLDLLHPDRWSSALKFSTKIGDRVKSRWSAAAESDLRFLAPEPATWQSSDVHQMETNRYWMSIADNQRQRFFGHHADMICAALILDMKKPAKLLAWRAFLVAGARNHRDLTLPPIIV
jgi:hypothetical protein